MEETRRYWPNPAHKRETTEAGPPAWHPGKEICPLLTVAERNALLASSLAADPQNPHSRRFALRRTAGGLEFFEAKFTREGEGGIEYHGHPTTFVPASVLRRWRDSNQISAAEYKDLVKALG